MCVAPAAVGLTVVGFAVVGDNDVGLAVVGFGVGDDVAPDVGAAVDSQRAPE